MKTRLHLTSGAAFALLATVFGTGAGAAEGAKADPANESGPAGKPLVIELSDDVATDPAAASVKATAIATSEDGGTITIRIDKDGRTDTRVIRLDGDDPAKAGALIAEAIKETAKEEPGKKDADRPDRKRTYLGVTLDESAGEGAAKLGIDEGVGLRVTSVGNDSPAAKAGLRENDILVRLDDQILVTPQQLIVLVRNKKAGESVRLTLFRDGGKHEVEATLGEADVRELGGGESELRLARPGKLIEELKDGAKRRLMRSRLLRVDPTGKVTEEIEEGDDLKKREWPIPWAEWQRESSDARKKVAEELSRAQDEMASRMKEEFARLREESEKLHAQFRNAQSELAEKFGVELKKAQAAAREAQRAAEKALGDLREREAAAKDAARKAADDDDRKSEDREKAEKDETTGDEKPKEE